MATKSSISVLARETPRDATMLGVATLLLSSDFERDGSPILETSAQTLTLQDTDLDFGHVKANWHVWAYGETPDARARWQSCDRALPRNWSGNAH